MANLGWKLTVCDELRPCYVIIGGTDKPVKALFHGWYRSGLGFVELENGDVYELKPSCIAFIDSVEKFKEIAWPEEENYE